MNDILINFLLFTLFLLVLLKAAEWFINAAEKIGLSFGVTPFIIGITVVAFGTSLPELATSIAAIYAGQSEIIVGNVVGSNITNIALVIGLIAAISKEIRIDEDIMNIDMPKLIASAIFLWFILADQQIQLLEAIVCMVGIGIFIAYSVSADRLLNIKDKPTVGWKDYGLLVLGGVLIFFSAKYSIDFATKFAIGVGIPMKIIGLTLIAFGTSLPELIISLQAIRKGKTGIAVGNVLGSNVFNSFVVMGLPAFFGPIVIPETIFDFSLPLMMALTILFGFMCITRRISRWEGLILLLFYVFFILKLF